MTCSFRVTPIVSGYVMYFDVLMHGEKIWVIHREYGFDSVDLPRNGESYVSESYDEAEFWRGLVGRLRLCSGETQLCIDITGLLVPYMMYLVALLSRIGVKKFDCVYSEPVSYLRREDTVFSGGYVREVRPVAGFAGFVDQDTSGDLLVIGAGYEDHLISAVAHHKECSAKSNSVRIALVEGGHVSTECLACESSGRIIGYGASAATFLCAGK